MDGSAADRWRVLEMIAAEHPLEEALDEVARSLSRSHAGLWAAVFMLRDGALAPATENGWDDPGQSRVWTAVAGRGLRLVATLGAMAAEAPGGVAGGAVAGEGVWAELGLADACEGLGLAGWWFAPIPSDDGLPPGVVIAVGNADTAGQSEAVAESIRTASRLAGIAVKHRRLAAQVMHRSHHDALTALPNRVLFDDRLEQAVARAARRGESVGLLLMNLDRFRVINDTLGPHVGDAVLQQVAARWREVCRQADTLARTGGDEFALISPDLSDKRDVARVAGRMLEALAEPILAGGQSLYVSASIGVAIFPEDGKDAGALQQSADAALARSKATGRNRFECFTPEMSTAALERLELESELRRAIPENQLRLHYQPKFGLDGRLSGLEALLRWHRAARDGDPGGLVPPGKFIPLAEETGLIVPIGTWVLNEACRQNKAWQRAGYPAIRVAVNVSAIQFAQANFVETVVEALRAAELDPRWLEVEITESLLMQSNQDCVDKLNRIRELGVTVAIDDFGTGYSSLSYLRRLPYDTLKIDRSFLKEIGAAGAAGLPPRASDGTSGGDKAIVQAIVSLAHGMGKSVVAEGVETPEQREFLHRIGCDGLQGFLLSVPLTAEKAGDVVAGAARRGEGEAA